MTRNKCMFRLFICVVISAIGLTLFCSYGASLTGNQIIFFIFSNASFHNKSNVLLIILSVLPQLIFTYFFSEYISSNFSFYCIYVFTRSKSRSKYLLRRLTGVAVWAIVFYCVLYLIEVFTIGVLKNDLDFILSFRGFLYLVPLNALSCILVTVIINLLSIRSDCFKVFIIVQGTRIYILLFYIFSLPPQVKKMVCFILPLEQGNLAWHETTDMILADAGLAVQGYTITFSVIYILFLLVFVVTLGMIRVNKMDLLPSNEGDK